MLTDKGSFLSLIDSTGHHITIYLHWFFSELRHTEMFPQIGGFNRAVGVIRHDIRTSAGLLENLKQTRRRMCVLSPGQPSFSKTVNLVMKNKKQHKLNGHFVWARCQHTQVDADMGPAYRHLSDSEKLKLEYMREKATLGKSLTPELEEQIVEGKRGKKYLLHQVQLFFSVI